MKEVKPSPTTDRHPDYPTALSRDEVQSGVPFVSFRPQGRVAMRGVFTSGAEYSEEEPRWTAEATLGDTGKVQTLRLYDMGITPDGTGQYWEDMVTIREDIE